MSDKTMVRFCTLGISMLFERREPDLDEPMRALLFNVVRKGLTDNNLTKLAKDIAKQDGVLTTDEYINNVLSQVDDNSRFSVAVEVAFIPQIIEKYEGHPLIANIGNHSFMSISRTELKERFGLLEGRYFCRSCDKERENEEAPCTSGSCHMGVKNFRGMQDINEQLQAHIDMINSDVGLSAKLRAVQADVPAPHLMPCCPLCEDNDAVSVDEYTDDGHCEYYCSDCDYYFYEDEDDDDE